MTTHSRLLLKSTNIQNALLVVFGKGIWTKLLQCSSKKSSNLLARTSQQWQILCWSIAPPSEQRPGCCPGKLVGNIGSRTSKTVLLVCVLQPDSRFPVSGLWLCPPTDLYEGMYMASHARPTGSLSPRPLMSRPLSSGFTAAAIFQSYDGLA